ncbi:xylose isomerase [Yersinia enterocolitica]|nr:xylose isomerase [Yersinia enterocolitica]
MDQQVAKRYAGWSTELGQQILKGKMSLEDLARYAAQQNLNPRHQSGHQELLENQVNRYIFG